MSALVEVDAARVVDLRQRLAALPGAVAAALGGAVRTQAQALAAVVRAGTGGGLARAAVDARVQALPGGAVAQVGVPADAGVPYAAALEYGFTGVEDVRACLRRVTQAFGRAIAPVQVPVAAYTRRVDIRPHPFWRPAFEVGADGIVAALRDAVGDAVARGLRP